MVLVCVCALLFPSLVTVSGRLATREFRQQPTRHREGNFENKDTENEDPKTEDLRKRDPLRNL